MKYLLPEDMRVQCPRCGVPTTTVAADPKYVGTVELNCGCVLPPSELTEAWNGA